MKELDSFYKRKGSKKKLVFDTYEGILLLRIIDGNKQMSIVVDEEDFEKLSQSQSKEKQ